MAPIILEEDDNICSAAIITLGDDSSQDGSIEDMDADLDLTIDEAVMIAEGVFPQNEDAQDEAPQNEDTESEDSHESSSGYESDSNDETIRYIDSPEQRPTEVDEIHLSESESEEENIVEESPVHVEMRETTTVEETHINIEADSDEAMSIIDESTVTVETHTTTVATETTEGELLIDLDQVPEPSHRRASLHDLEDLEDESSLLDSPIVEQGRWTVIGFNSSPVREEAANAGVADRALTFDQELADMGEEQGFEQSSPAPGNVIASTDPDSDQDSFRSFESDIEEESDGSSTDEGMEAGNQSIWKGLRRSNWISKDYSRIFDESTDEMVPMPVNITDRKRAFIKLFMLLSRIVFFVDLGVRQSRVFKLIPERFWRQHFTWTDSQQLFEARDAEICINLLSRTKTVLEEWRLVAGFPRVPETEKDVKEAAIDGRKVDRQRRVECLLQTKSHRSDRWLKHIFLEFVDCLPWETILAADSEIRNAAIKKVITMTELVFEQRISIVEEFMDVKKRRDLMQNIVDKQLDAILQKTSKLNLLG